ncbi:type I polyketide synthase [Poseidonocella sedimentorum]|uniref:Acyl transferase domain-containing protein n=1 Tax=Poseidonocella sedimentorum TaxID=871652 RepID=A0A1I6DL19_9RHOB|nr:type I polyketide synthase [Poseidonocella sedimentorum]SFR06129.1 Acyl transferase domain-containing protein [Poseidonocella sedimentorum]
MTEQSDARILLLSAPDRETLLRRLSAARSAPTPPAREDEPVRLALLCRDGDHASQIDRAEARLARSDPATEATARFALAGSVFFADNSAGADAPATALLFPGFGAHNPRLMAELRRDFPAADTWLGGLQQARRRALLANPLLVPQSSERGGTSADDGRGAGLDQEIEAVIAASLCLWEVLHDLCPDLPANALVGHSYGELSMLPAAGIVASADAALDIGDQLISRVRRMAGAGDVALAKTSMLAVTAAGRDALGDAITGAGAVSIALDNCPQQTVLCGPADHMAEIEQRLRRAGHVSFRLEGLPIAVHTAGFPLPDAELAEIYASVDVQPPRIPAYSCCSAAPFVDDPAAIRSLLAAQWSRPMRFRETIERLHEDGVHRFIEVGPGGNLTGFVRDILRGKKATALAANTAARPARDGVLGLIGRLFVEGHPVRVPPAFEAGGTTAQSRVTEPASKDPAPAEGEMQALVTGLVMDLLGDEAEEIDPEVGFFDLGLGSLDVVELTDRLSTRLGRQLPQTVAFDHPTVRRLSAFLTRQTDPSAGSSARIAAPRARTAATGDIAIIGIGCRVPSASDAEAEGAEGPEALWKTLQDGADVVGSVPEDRWTAASLRAAGIETASQAIEHGAFLRDIAGFDPAFFGISPREARTLDPQQRLLLEVAQAAFEDACLPVAELPQSRTGVYVGISTNDYAQRLTMRERLEIGGYLGSGNTPSTAAGRLSFVFGLSGPCLALDTACSSSLVAVHLAVRALRAGEADVALAGGVNLIISPETSLLLARAGALSPRGRCRSFDAGADGYVRGEGCALVALKRLEDAVADGDHIRAVIKGSAINHDGRTSGLTVPNGPAQQALLRAALDDAGMVPDQIGCIEAHGTGTALGDPIEVGALGAVFAGRASALGKVTLGSVKSNLGHLEAAAGVVGLIKAVLQTERRRIVASLHMETPNPRIAWDSMALDVAREGKDWPEDMPEATGISSFGISGTNAHVIIAPAPPVAENMRRPAPSLAGEAESTSTADAAAARPVPLVLSAHSPTALTRLRNRMMAQLADGAAKAEFRDICIASHLGRDALSHRLAIVAEDRGTARAALERAVPARARGRPRLAFLYSGQGSQMSGMGQGLYAAEPVFRAAVDACAARLDPLLGRPLTDVMFGISDLLHQTRYTQPAIFTLQVALDDLLRARGITPDAVLGHSVGEIAAAHRAGCLSLEDAAGLAEARGRLMQSVAEDGAMLAVALDEGALSTLLATHRIELSIAAVNAPASTVLSGRTEEIIRAERALKAAGHHVSRLRVSHAFHSELMEPILPDLARFAAGLAQSPPRMTMVSSLTGAPLETAPDADYWAAQLRGAVRFAQSLDALRATGVDTFLELGGRPVLSGLVGDTSVAGAGPADAADRNNEEALCCLAPARPDPVAFAEALAGLHVRGVNVDWTETLGTDRWRRVALPPTPFDRRRYWIDADIAPGAQGIPPPKSDATAPPQTEPEAPEAAGSTPRIIATLRALPDDASPADMALHELRRSFASVLGGPLPAGFDASDPLTGAGLDSLMALGLRRELHTDFGIDVPLVRLVDRETLASLCAKVLARLEQERSGTAAPSPVPVSEDKALALSHGQRALWMLWRMAPNSTAYTISLPLDVPAPARAADWQRAADALVAAHPMLRATIRDTARGPALRVLPAGPAGWDAVDARGLSADRLKQRLQRAHDAPFDLASGPVCRFHWFALDDGAARLLVSIHHAFADGWSLEIIRRQLLHLVDGGQIALDAGHTEAMRRAKAQLTGDEGARRLGYWRDRLAAPLPVLALPTDLPRPKVKSFRGRGTALSFTAATSDRVHTLARALGATPYTVCLACTLAFLHRYTGQTDLVIGSPQSGRDDAAMAEAVGYFVNPIAIRSLLAEGETFRDLAARVRGAVLEALDHDYPLALLVETLRIARDPGRSPLFDASFNFVSGGAEADFGRRGPAQGDGKFDLTVTLVDGAQINGWLGLDAALFTAEGADRMARVFEAFAAQLLAAPERPLAQIGSAETGAPALQGGALPEGWATPVVDRLEQLSLATPDVAAIAAEDARLSYGALWERVLAGAKQLQRAGAEPGAVVAVTARREAAFVIGVLACHRAGATPALIDPDWPDAVTQAAIATSGAALCLDRGRLSPVAASSAAPRPPKRPAAAYIAFTSGTTGRPKGVIVPQTALSAYLTSIVEDLAFAPGATFAHCSAPAADLGMTMLFGAFAAGGTLHILPKPVCLDPALFKAAMHDAAIDYLKITPSHFAALTEGGIVLPRRALILGGEPARADWVARLSASDPRVQIYNHYGPTETTIGVMTGQFQAPPDSEGKNRCLQDSLPLERVTMGSAVHLVDAAGRDVLPGAVGELAVSGIALAEGYLEDGTGDQGGFLRRGGQRLYRTGDLARQLPDGRVTVLGRKDRQIKLRGHRVDLTQIEAALTVVDNTRQAHVLATAAGLVAFVPRGETRDTPRPARAGSAAEARRLRARMAEILPAPSVPNRIVLLDRLPLTENGKRDEAALRKLLDTEPRVARVADRPSAPQGAAEQGLATIWAELLSHPGPPRDASFFDLGGHSLLAVRMIAMIADRWGVDLPVTTVLSNPTIQSLAPQIRMAGQRHPLIVPLSDGGVGAPVFLVPGAGGSPVYLRALAQTLDGNRPAWGLRGFGHAPTEKIPATVDETADCYLSEVLEATKGSACHLVGHSFGAFVAFELAKRLTARGGRVASLTILDNPAPARAPGNAPKDDIEWVRHIGLRIGKLTGQTLDLRPRGVVGSYAEAVDQLASRLTQAGVLPADLTPEQFGRFIAVYRSNAEAATRYRPAALAPPVPVHVVRARHLDADLGQPTDPDGTPTLGWEAFVARTPTASAVPGTHLSMFLPPQVSTLAQTLSGWLDRADHRTQAEPVS